MLTKKQMVLRVVELYGKGSSLAMWFAKVATTKDYEHTRKIFYEIIQHYKEKNNG